MQNNPIAVRTDTTIPSLPQRLAALAGEVGTVQHPGQPLRYNFPGGVALSPLEREQATSLLSTFNLDLSPDAPFAVDVDGVPTVVDGHMAKGALLTKMIKGLGGAAEPSDIASTSKIEMYADAIEDLPAWAIDRAIKRWARGDCPKEIEKEPNYNFPPSPAALRKLAKSATEIHDMQKRRLERLLAAIPLERAMDPTPMPKEFGVGPPLRRM